MYKQPRPPEPRQDMGVWPYLRALVVFLKENSLDVWMAIKNLTERKVDLSGVEGGIEGLKGDVEALEDKVDGLTAEDVGALPAGAQAADSAKLDGRTWAQVLDAIYPVGSIYMSVDATDPAQRFGGVWERIKDAFLLAAGDTYAAGSTGGEAAVTLEESQMPAHTHETAMFNNEGTANQYAIFGQGRSLTELNAPSGYREYFNDWSNAPAERDEKSQLTNTSGGGEAHNNMPPYLAVYMWKRTA